MSLFRIILKQLRQRSLSTVLTILSVALGVALATAILIIQREGDKLFGQQEYGYDVIVGPKGSKLQLVLNNVYQISEAQGTVPYSVYADLTTRLRRDVRWVAPIATGDNYRGHRLIATQPKIIETPELASVRQTVQDKFAAARPLLQKLRERALPAPDAPELPALFTMQPELLILAPEADPFDPEARVALERAGEAMGDLIDLVSTSSDRNAVDAGIDATEDALGQAVALLGGPIEVRPDEAFELATGKPFAHDKFQAVAGAEVAQKLNLKLGDQIEAEHGAAGAGGDHHDEKWEIVGILKPTRTAFDRVILVPYASFLAIPAHDEALEEFAKIHDAYQRSNPGDSVPPPEPEARKDEDHHDHAYRLIDGHIELTLEKEKWQLSSVLVKARTGQSVLSLITNYRQTPDAMAVNPAMEMREFFSTVLRGSSVVLLVLAVLVSVVAAVSILVSIYNSISSRRREIAILRALGATRQRILTIICLEAGVIGLIGAICGLALGMGLAAIGSTLLKKEVGQSLHWATLSTAELLYFGAAVALAIVAGLVPALKAYRTPVADNLVAE